MSRLGRRAGAALMAASLQTAVAAQTIRPEILIPEVSPAPSIVMEQLQTGADAGELPAQVSASGQSIDLPQVTEQGASAESAPPLSLRRDGRPQPAMAIAGEDLCEQPGKGKEGVDCSRVLESRSAEFARPAASHSAEQALLLSVTSPPSGSAAGSNPKLVGTDPNSRDNQELASVTLPPPPLAPEPQAAPQDLGAGLSEIIDALKTSVFPQGAN